jgi:iron-sulfur cluster assembly protein
MDPAVQITPSALKEIKNIIEKKNIPEGYGLRITIKGGKGCTSVNHTLGFDQVTDQDITYQLEGLNVMIRKGELMYLIGKKIDFYEGSDARGFVFENQEDNSTEAL